LFASRNRILLPFECNILDLSNALRCRGTCFSFLAQPAVVAALKNPPSEHGVGRIIDGYEAVTALQSEFRQIFKAFVPSRIIWLLFNFNTIELSNMLAVMGIGFPS
jgi:hypothetical protein